MPQRAESAPESFRSISPRAVHSWTTSCSAGSTYFPHSMGWSPACSTSSGSTTSVFACSTSPRAITIAHDKLLTAQILAAAGLPHPSTVHISDGRGASIPFAPPYVVKPRFGSWGKDVVRAETKRELRRSAGSAPTAPVVREAWRARAAARRERLHRPPRDRRREQSDRGHQPRRSCRRVADECRPRREPRPNRPAPVSVNVALAAAAAVGGDLVGVDLLATGNTFTVLEVNGCVDFTQH